MKELYEVVKIPGVTSDPFDERESKRFLIETLEARDQWFRLLIKDFGTIRFDVNNGFYVISRSTRFLDKLQMTFFDVDENPFSHIEYDINQIGIEGYGDMIRDLPFGTEVKVYGGNESAKLLRFEYDDESFGYFAVVSLNDVEHRKLIQGQGNDYFITFGTKREETLRRFQFDENTKYELDHFISDNQYRLLSPHGEEILEKSSAPNNITQRENVNGEPNQINIKRSNGMATNDVSKDENVEKDAKELLKEQFENGIKAVLDSDSFKDWCNTRSKLFYNNYSFINSMLIMIQKPNASYVMGYEQWQQVGRQVTREAKGNSIEIFQPVFVKEYGEKGSLLTTIKKSHANQFKKDPSIDSAVFPLGSTKLNFIGYKNGLMDVNFNGKTIMAKATDAQIRNFLTQSVIGKMPASYKIAHVFDLEHTIVPDYVYLRSGFETKDLVLDENGKPIKTNDGRFKVVNTPERIDKFKPQLDMSIAEMNEEKMNLLFDVLVEVNAKYGIPVTLEKLNGAYGQYSRTENKITIDERITPTEKIATMFHEMSHAKLHNDLEALKGKVDDLKIDRQLLEMQAEASSYIVAKSFGIDTSTSSFNYIASYSKGRELKEIEKSLDLIISETRKLTTDIKDVLQAKGFDMNLEPNNTTQTQLVDIVKAAKAVCVEKSAILDGTILEITDDLSNVSSIREKDILNEQLNICRNIFTDIEELDKIITSAEKNDFISSQMKTSIEQKQMIIEARFEEVEKLGIERVSVILDEKKDLNTNLKDSYKADKFSTLVHMKNQHPLLNQMSNYELEYIAKSSYIKSKFERYIGKDNERFVNESAVRVNAIREVISNNGCFVELNSLEPIEGEILKAGSIMHVAVADEIVKKLETKVNELKFDAKSKNEYYPYIKSQWTVYSPHENGHLDATIMRIDIGDGRQSGLLDFIDKANASGEHIPVKALYDASKSFTSEKANIIEPVLEKGKEPVFNLEHWKGDVAELRKQIAESESPSNEKEYSELERG